MNELFRAINKMATPKGKPEYGSPEWHEEARAIARRAMVTPVFDINALDPLHHRKSALGHDEQAEFVERDQDYPMGMK